MRPASILIIVGCLFSLAALLSIYLNPTRKQVSDPTRSHSTSIGRKERKHRAKIDKAWAKTIRDAEAHLIIGADYTTSSGLTVDADELHDWILYQVTHHPGLHHDGYGCTWCADKNWQNSTQEKTADGFAEKRQPEILENVPGKTPENGGEKTSGDNPGKTLGDIAGIKYAEITQAHMDKLAEELSRKTPREDSAKKPADTSWVNTGQAGGGKIPTNIKVPYESTFVSTWEAVRDPGTQGPGRKPCPLLNPHAAHPRSSSGEDWCPGITEPKPSPVASAVLWCGDHSPHLCHMWSNVNVDTVCMGTRQAADDDEHRRLSKRYGVSGWVLPPKTQGQNDIVGVDGGEITEYKRCPQRIPHASHQWTPPLHHRFCDGLNTSDVPAPALDNGYIITDDCPDVWPSYTPHPPHPYLYGHDRKKRWCPGWTGPAPR